MNVNHHFLLLRRAEHDYGDYESSHHHPDAALLHDDLVRYIANTLSWFPTLVPWSTHLRRGGTPRPTRTTPHTGLNLYGPTVITDEGAAAAGCIFWRWADLFACGPSTLDLCSHDTYQNEKQQAKDEYERAKFDRDEVVHVLRQLTAWCDEVATSDGALYILHLGI